LERHPWLLNWLQRRIEQHNTKTRLKKGFDTMDPRAETTADTSSPADLEADDQEAAVDLDLVQHPTLEILATEAEKDTSSTPTQASLSRRLALSIKKISTDLRLSTPKRYTYEEWVEFTRLIRLTHPERLNRVLSTTLSNTGTENEEGLVNWDWIGNDSPMMSGFTESEWLLERLCESLVRLERRKELACEHLDFSAMRKMERSLSGEKLEDLVEDREDLVRQSAHVVGPSGT
jgi:potassium channel subfamily K